MPSPRKGPTYPVKGAKISGDPTVQVSEAGLNESIITVTPIVQVGTLGLDNRRVTSVQHRLSRQENLSDDSEGESLVGISRLEAMQLYETDEEDMSMVSSQPLSTAALAASTTQQTPDPTKLPSTSGGKTGGTKADEVQLDAPARGCPGDSHSVSSDSKPAKSAKTLEQRMKSGYKNAKKFLTKLAGRDQASLSPRDKALKRKHELTLRRYEERTNSSANLNATVMEAKATAPPILTQTQEPVGAGKPPKTSQPLGGETKVGTSSKRQRSEESAQIVGGAAKRKATLPKPDNPTEKPSTSGSSAEGTRAKAAQPKAKRQCANEKQVNESKQLKPSASLTSAPELQIAIIDRNHPEGKISTDNWLKLEEQIIRKLLSEMVRTGSDAISKYDGAKWQKGVKVVGCGNKESKDFLTTCVQQHHDLWTGAKLEVVALADIPSRTIVRVWVPPPIIEDANTLQLIKLQNADVHPDDWVITRGHARDKGNGKDLWIKIGSESLQILSQKEGVIRYGIGHLRMILPSSSKSDEQPKNSAD